MRAISGRLVTPRRRGEHIVSNRTRGTNSSSTAFAFPIFPCLSRFTPRTIGVGCISSLLHGAPRHALIQLSADDWAWHDRPGPTSTRRRPDARLPRLSAAHRPRRVKMHEDPATILTAELRSDAGRAGRCSCGALLSGERAFHSRERVERWGDSENMDYSRISRQHANLLKPPIFRDGEAESTPRTIMKVRQASKTRSWAQP